MRKFECYHFKDETIEKIPEIVEFLKQRVNIREIVTKTGINRSTVYRINDCFRMGIIEKTLSEHANKAKTCKCGRPIKAHGLCRKCYAKVFLATR